MNPWPIVWTLLLLAATVAAAAPADAQSPRVYRIGVIANALETADGPNFEAFLAGLAKLGYIGDKNLDIVWRSSEGDFEALPGLAADLVRSRVDLIVATSLQPARAAAAATKTIPIVFVVGADPVAHGLVANVGRPGGNVTGFATYQPVELGSRVVQLLREVSPSLSRLAVLTNPSNPVHRELMSQPLATAAQKAAMTLVPLEIRALNELPGAFEMATRERAQALYVLGDILAFIYRTRIVDLAARNRLPAIYSSRRAVEVGGLMSYGPDLRDLFRRAAVYADRILKGARPGELAVEQPAKFELAVNLKTARALGITIPESVRRRADHVIQ